MVEIKTGPKEIVDETSNVTYRLYDAQFFSNIDEAGIDYSEDDLALEFLGPEEAGFILMKMGNKCPVEIPENLRQIQSLPKPQRFFLPRKRITPVHASANHARHARFRVTLCGSA